MRFFSISILFFSVFLTGCSLINKEEPIPCYIKINQIALSADYLTQGSTSSKFTDAWVYVNDELIGIFELPVTFPVITSEGVHEIKVRAGIKNNGISTNRVVYPVCDFYITNQNLFIDSVVTISPTVKYYTTTTFKWLEDFDGAAIGFTKGNGSDTIIKQTTSAVFEGVKSGAVNLTPSEDYFEGKSTQSYTLPKGGAEVYLELNYKSNNPFEVGVYPSGGQAQTALNINPTSDWNKIYIHLSPIIGPTTNNNPFSIYVKMTKDAGIDYPELLLDNIKLVHL